MKISVVGLKGRVINKSTNYSVYEEAYIVADAEDERITKAILLGKGLQTWTFSKHWEVSTVAYITLYFEAERIS